MHDARCLKELLSWSRCEYASLYVNFNVLDAVGLAAGKIACQTDFGAERAPLQPAIRKTGCHSNDPIGNHDERGRRLTTVPAGRSETT